MNSPEISSLVAAQDRTTHAVRAIAVFILYPLVFNIIGGIFIGISLGISAGSYDGASSAGGGFVFGALIIAAGNLFALVKALGELGKSNAAKSLAALASPSSESIDGGSMGENKVYCKSCGAPNASNSFRCTKCDGIVE